ncbi:MAG: Serine/threonine-protein kinase PknB [Pseudomonadota bacterium]
MNAVDATSALPPDYRLFKSGALCGKYVIVRMIAKGGMSEVYEALHTDLQKRVALKVLSPELRHHAEAHARFAAEALNTASVGHTNVIDVIDCGSIFGLPYLVMNLLVGRDLAALYAQSAPLRPSELLDVLLPVALAVAVGHERGIMHRDLKPGNIFLHSEAGRIVPKLLDFGVSRMQGARRITSHALIFGTPQYMAPEQARGETTTDPRVDQYALGVILYEGLTGRLPRTETHPYVLLYSVAFGSFEPPSTHVQLPPGLEAIILRAMARDPNQRFASMRALIGALLPYASPQVRAYWLSTEAGFSGSAGHATRASLRPAQAPVLSVPALVLALWRLRSLVAVSAAATLVLSALGVWTVAQYVAGLAAHLGY